MANQLKIWWQKAIAAVKAAIDYLFSWFTPRQRAVQLKLRFTPLSHLLFLEGKLMQVLTKEGSNVALSAIDAQGLAAAVPDPKDWKVTGSFTIDVAPDGLSAVVRPNGDTSQGALVVTAGSLTVTEDLSFTSEVEAPPEAVKLNLTFTTIAPPPPVVVS